MLKSSIFIIVFFISYSAYSQNLRLLESFNKIPMSSKRFEIEGTMNSFSGFKQTKVADNWDLPKKRYIAIEYSSSTGDELILFFYEGVLYQKRLILKYSLNDLELAKEEYANLKKYVKTKNVIMRISGGEITNKAYGGQIGQGENYFLTNSSKNHKVISADFSGILDFSYDFSHENAKTITKIIGYKIVYEHVDLSKTILDAKTGFSSY